MSDTNHEILFKGKTVVESKWVQGYYVCLNGKEHRIYTGYAETDTGVYYPDCYTVCPETVCRYIDLTDKNGKGIFEGDICKDSLGHVFVVEWDAKNARFIGCAKINGERHITYIGREPRVEIIGNIHDDNTAIFSLD